MFPIMLSDETWRAGKASLHAALSAIRSSHLAEAIAPGARQHASIVPKLHPDARGHCTLMLERDDLDPRTTLGRSCPLPQTQRSFTIFGSRRALQVDSTEWRSATDACRKAREWQAAGSTRLRGP